MIKIEDKTGEVRQSISDALRREFDDRNTHHLRLIEIMETTEHINYDAYREMESDLISMGVIHESYNLKRKGIKKATE